MLRATMRSRSPIGVSLTNASQGPKSSWGGGAVRREPRRRGPTCRRHVPGDTFDRVPSRIVKRSVRSVAGLPMKHGPAEGGHSYGENHAGESQLPLRRRSRGSRLEVGVDGFDEHVRGPRARGGAVPRIVIGSDFCRPDLFERRPVPDQGLYAVADDDDHVPVLDDLVLVAQVSVTGDDQRAALALMLKDRSAEDVVERANLSLHAATGAHIDERKLG